MAMAMMAMLQQHLGLTHQDRELVSLPLLGVIAVCIGCTAVIADMNPSKPAEADPEKIVDAIRQYQITTMFGSPALLDRIARYGTQHGIHLPSLRCVNAGGAPITLATLAEFQTLLSDTAQLHVTYGATEGLPLASISARKLLGEMRSLIEDGQGTPLGHAIHPVQVRIIRMHDGALPIWRDDLLVSGQEVGEIIISGPNISTAYYQAPEADAAHKIREQNGAECVIWHRTGDLAWRSEDAQLIFCGRMSHRVRCANGELLFSVAAEGISNAHPKVHRSALVGVQLQGASQAVMCIELREAASPAQEQAIRQELLGLLQQHASTKQVRTILFHRSFPVDIRHNAKIERPKLAQWAQHELSRKPSSTNQALALKLIPIFGWLYILLGLLIDLPPGFWTWCWYIDIFLSVVVHAAQMPLGISIGKLHGYSRREAALQTFIFGATWWKPLRFSQTNPTTAPAQEKLQ